MAFWFVVSRHHQPGHAVSGGVSAAGCGCPGSSGSGIQKDALEFVRWKVALPPPALAVTSYAPARKLAVAAALAAPSAPVVAVNVAGLVLGPEAGAVKVTTTPGSRDAGVVYDGHLQRGRKGGAGRCALVVAPGDGQPYC